MKVKSLSLVQLLATLWSAAYQAPLSMGFSRQEYWSGVPLPSPIILNSVKLKAFFSKTGTKTMIPTLTITYSTQDCQVLVTAIRQEKEIEVMQIGKKVKISLCG